MIEDRLLDEFAKRIRAETMEKIEEAGEGDPLTDEVAVADVMLGYLEEAGTIGEHEFCPHQDTTGRNRCEVIGFALPEESGRLELFSAAYVSEEGSQTLPAEELRRLAGCAARFFEYAAKGDVDRFAGNEQTLEAVRSIKRELNRIEEVRVYILTNGTVRDRAINSISIVDRPVDFSVFDLERLYRASQEGITRDLIEIDFTSPALLGRPLPCLEMKPPAKEYQTFLAVLPGNLIYQLYDEYGARLFEFNVRSFLQARGKVNKGLRETLKTNPERFLAYNNGITATADEIDVGQCDGETVIRRIKGLQIVNGAQTTASIHRARKIDKVSVDKVAVSMKLTKVDPGKLAEIVPLIAEFANTQNVVQVADLSANNAFHIHIERLSEKVWCPGEESRWFYERARGAYQVAAFRYGTTPARLRDFELECPKGQHFSKTDLTRDLVAWWQRPQTVSRGPQKNFAIFMNELPTRFPLGWVPDETFYKQAVSLHILFERARSVARRLKLPSFGPQTAAYAIAKLSVDWRDRFDLETIWDYQCVSDELEAVVTDWMRQIHESFFQGPHRGDVGEWCKKDDCWEAVKALDLPMSSPYPREIVDETEPTERIVGVHAGSETLDTVRLCCEFDGAHWAQVVAWAASTSKVTPFERKVANTIAGYAMDGWRKRPTEKQAKFGASVLKAAADAGVVELAEV